MDRFSSITDHDLIALWKLIIDNRESSCWKFHGSTLLNHFACEKRPFERDLPRAIVTMDVNCSTGEMAVLHGAVEVRNDSWKFESIRTGRGVRGGRWYFEVQLLTPGIVQVGWASARSVFDAECGSGVGDDSHSYSYDGFRQRKWHGKRHEDNVYGKAWRMGDVVSCLADLDAGALRYWQNGEDLGVAFEGVNVEETWYPAVSLSSNQQCRFVFGNPGDVFRHKMPDEYRAMSDGYLMSSVTTRYDQ